MSDFFDKDEKPQAPPTIKVGEKEYSQDELSQLVGLGETAREYETKWNRKIGEFYPDYTQKSQKLADYERQLEERLRIDEERRKVELEEKKPKDLTPEEARELALRQAKELGIVTKDEFSQEIQKAVFNALAGKELIADSKAVISEAVEKGLPNVELDQLLKYMDGENPTRTRFGTPQKAYDDMFEKERDQWKEETLKGIKPPGMTTQTTSTAGGKQPPPPQPISRDNLAQAIRESLTRSRGV